MLPKENRIDVKLFDKVFKEGRSYHSELLHLRTLDIKSQKKSRFAFVIPKKIIKKAVTRNKLRRQGYDIINSYIKSSKPIASSIFILKKDPTKQEKNLYKEEIATLLKKVQIT